MSLKKYMQYLQLILAIVISLLFQFVIPFSWQPLDAFLNPGIQHGDPGTNLVLFTISQWYFSFSIVWFLKRDNIYINNFLIYSIPALFMTVMLEFFVFGIYYDYIHLLPLILSFVIIIKQRGTLRPKYTIHYIIMYSSWLFIVYFLKLAYYNDPLIDFVIKWAIIYLINILIVIIVAFVQRHEEKRRIK